MKRIFSIITAVFLFVGAISLFSCGKEPPPDGGTPEPRPVYGEYIADGSVLIFRADHIIDLDITEEFSKSSGLPVGKSEGTYVFLFHNEEWRYDKAETLRITIGGVNYTFANAVGTTGEKTLAFYLTGGDIVSFDKTEE